MRQEKKLTLGMSLLFIIVFITFGFIIINEKDSMLFLPKVDKKLNTYFNKNYKKIKKEVNLEKTKFIDNKYKLKVVSKKNKNLYFYIIRYNKKTTSTYKKDYLEGKSLLTKTEKDLSKDISPILKENISIKINNKLNNFSEKVRNKIIKGKNLIDLSIYNIDKTIEVDEFTTDEIYKFINDFKDNCDKNNIKPKTYSFTIDNKKDITKSIKINNIPSDLIKKEEFKSIISDILNNNNSNTIKKYNITYKYLN